MTITVIGAGYVGLVTAVLLANVGHKVYCVENNKEKYTLLSQGICYFYEDGLQDELTQAIAKGTIKFMLTAPEAVSQSRRRSPGFAGSLPIAAGACALSVLCGFPNS